jgi:SAM-dependent methyltransferase
MTGAIRPFDPALRRRRRARAVVSLPGADFLHREVADRVLERLGEIRRRFARVLELGAVGGIGRRLIASGQAASVVTLDPVAALLDPRTGPVVVADEEFLPLAAGSVDAVVSALALHAVNDLPGLLAQLVHALRPDGLLLLAFPGGESLKELRWALTQAELELRSGAAMRVGPCVDIRDAAALLQRAGLALPVADLDRITLTYADPLRLLADLRAVGETLASAERPRHPLRRDVLARALALYRERFADPATGRVPATIDILFMTGWKPHAAQPRALRRGSGEHSLAAALGTTFRPVPGTDPDRA